MIVRCVAVPFIETVSDDGFLVWLLATFPVVFMVAEA